MPLQSHQQLGKLQKSVDPGVSADRYLHEMAPSIIPLPFLMDTSTIFTKSSYNETSTNLEINPEHPEHPGTPKHPEHPEHPEHPGTPEHPGHPETPEYPGHSGHPEPLEPPEPPSTSSEGPRTLETPQTKIPQIKLGYLGIHEKPEELRPPVVNGIINGRVARIMLDSGCSTYVLSTDFARDNNISCYSCKPIPVELAVRDAGQFNLDTQTKKLPMNIGKITQEKALYVLPLPGCDAIFGMPFLNGRKLTTNLKKGTISIDDMELPLVKNLDEPIQISVIS